MIAAPGGRFHIGGMRNPLLALLMIAAVGAAASLPASAQPMPGQGGRMQETLLPGQQQPTSMPPSASVPPGGTSAGARYPSTQSLSTDRIQSQGYKVERITPKYDGEWKAQTTRDPVPTRPRGVPTKVTILPNGQMLEEYN
jgi:hypothetical protein